MIGHFISTVISSFWIVINDIGFSIDQKDVGPIDLHAFNRKWEHFNYYSLSFY